MTVPELAESSAAVRSGGSPQMRPSIAARVTVPAAAVAALIVVGAVIRVIVAHQPVFADELSTYWISVTHGLGGVLSLMYGTGRIAHAEITPPLSFLASWLTTRIDHSTELLRLPALLAGTLSIPLVYLVGRRTVGRLAALLAAALTALSPFMIYYSAEARAYGLMMFLVLTSTLAMLLALETRRTRWWVLYGVSSCAAFYTHYTSAFGLGAQFLWLVWAEPGARRPALWANIGAAAGVLPWITGLINDFNSPTLNILSALSPFNPHEIRLDLEHWAIGYPYTLAGGLRGLPGTAALLALGGAAGLTAAGLATRLRGRRSTIDRRVWLVGLLVLATPVGEAVASAGGNHIFGVRNLAASWPYLALAGAALVMACGPRVRAVAAGLAVLAFGFGSVKMLGSRFARPDYQGAADFVAAHARSGDVVIDETGALSPGPLTGLDITLHRNLPVFRAQAPLERDHPYGFGDPIVPLAAAIGRAVTAAHGHRVFVVTNTFSTGITQLQLRLHPGTGRFPAPYRRVQAAPFTGMGSPLVEVYAAAGSPPR